MNGKWKKLASKYIYKNPWIGIREDEVIMPDGQNGIYGVVELPRGVCIIPVQKDGRIWMVKHYRYIFDDSHWELAAGDIESGESAEQAGKRELLEELDLVAEDWKTLGQFRSTNGSADQTAHVLAATGLIKQKSPTDEWDIEERKTFSIKEIDQMIKGGEIVDGFVMNALYFYKLFITS